MADASDSVVSLAVKEEEKYCSECRDKILRWKRDPGADQNYGFGNYQDQALHTNLQDLIECAEWCKFCGYICSIFGEECLQSYTIKSSDDQSLCFVVYGLDGSLCDDDGTYRKVSATTNVQYVDGFTQYDVRTVIVHAADRKFTFST
jgi:hypothetical protein